MRRLGVFAKLARKLLSHPYLTLSTRIALGGLFIFAGVAKLPSLSTFVGEVNLYHILPSSLGTAYGYVLPGLEVALGTLLILGLLLRISASVSILMVISFIIAKSAALARGLDIPVCGCFGPAVPLLTTQSLALDFVLLALAFQILFHRGDLLALGPWISQKGAEQEE